MEVRRKKPIKKVAACLMGQAARKNKLHTKSYQKPAQLSSVNLKEQIGLLLWLLCSPLSHRQRSSGWQLFGILLSQLYQINAQNTHQGHSTTPERDNKCSR